MTTVRQAVRRIRWRNAGLVLLVWLTAGCSGRDYRALLVLQDLAADGGPSRLQTTTPPPERRLLSYRVEGRERLGDLYVPGEAPLGRLVLVPGVQQRGKDDPRLVQFAMTLARARFLVLVPELPGLRELRIGPDDVRPIADAVRHLGSREAATARHLTGIGAFSYAAGPALLAAMDERIADQVEFVLAVGGYHDLREVLAFFTTGWFRHAGRWRHMEPNHYGRWVFVLANVGRLEDPTDRRLLTRMGERRLADPTAALDDLAADLGPEGRAVHALLENDDPTRAPELIARLPEPIRADLAALDLASKDVTRLQADLILIHGRDDDIIPFTQSLALAGRLPRDQVELYLIDGLFHVDLEPGPVDGWRLFRAIRSVLRYQRPND